MSTPSRTKNPGKLELAGRTIACDLLIRNGHIFTLDAQRRVFAGGSIAIAGNRIVAVGSDRDVQARYTSTQVIDVHGAPVHPGIVDAHYHPTLHTTRGAVSDDPAAFANLGNEPGPYSRWINAMTDEDEYASCALACVEMVKNGVTTFMDAGTTLEPDVSAKAAAEIGIRASVTEPFLWDHIGGLASAVEIERAPATRSRAMKLLGSQLWRNKDDDALVRGHVTLYGQATASDELALAAKQCADQAGVALSAHQSFDPSDAEYDDRRFGRHPLVHYAEIGVLGKNVSFVHMNALRDDEISAIAGSGMSVVWHPGNYQFYSIAKARRSRMPELIAKGVNVCFGTDAAKVWTFGDLPFIGYLVAREEGSYLPVESILEMQTINAARALSLDRVIGSIEIGKRADIVIRSQQLAESQPGLNVLREIVLVSRSKSVDTVIVDGKIIVRQGRLTLSDEAAIFARARTSARKLAGRIGVTTGSVWERSDRPN